LKFSAVTPSVFCTSGDHTAIPGFVVVVVALLLPFVVGGVGVDVVCADPTCPATIATASPTPQIRRINTIKFTHPPVSYREATQ
jgi:hypothetical protein